jgi:hypothetical protein
LCECPVSESKNSRSRVNCCAMLCPFHPSECNSWRANANASNSSALLLCCLRTLFLVLTSNF